MSYTLPYTITDQTITIYVDGEPFTVDRSTQTYAKLVEVLSNPNLRQMPRFQHQLVKQILDHYGLELETMREENKDKIVVTRRNVLFNGEPINEVLEARMLDIQAQGLPLDPWIAFAENLYSNPSSVAREELYLWLEKADLPITEDGHFLAYKRVSDSFYDLHSGTFDNSPGKVVEMPRHEVDPIRDNVCSTGLHFCSKEYLPYFGGYGGDRVVLVKINPADVVSIPSDYDNTKGRTWRYEVIKEVDVQSAQWAAVVAPDASPFNKDPYGRPIPPRYTIRINSGLFDDPGPDVDEEWVCDQCGENEDWCECEQYDEFEEAYQNSRL